MKALSLKVLTVAAALGLSPLLLSAQVQADTPNAQLNSGANIVGQVLPSEHLNAQIDPMVLEGTAHLNLDDATRARYRYHEGRWWFLTQQGQWLVDHNGTWKIFDPMTYQNSQTVSGSTDYVGTSAYGNYSGNGSYTHRSHHHGFSGIHYGHWGTGFRDGSR
tara:strand:+ start:34041 stop:34526 length:486 start_codon:yes stop_codon:yes gene_type:complete